MKQTLQLHPADNVAVILTDNNSVAPRGHKIALRNIAKGEPVVKYGFPIGRATQNIAEGEWGSFPQPCDSLGRQRGVYLP